VDATEPPAVVLETAPVADRREPRTVELGVGTFLMAGVGTGGIVGLSPFVIGGLGEDGVLRFAISVGESPGTLQFSTWMATRLDACLRLPGNYRSSQGLQLDLCGGTDVGFSHIAPATSPDGPRIAQTLPYVDVGPSADLRGEIGSILTVSLRGGLGVNIVRQGFEGPTGERVDPPLGSTRLELAFSWKLQ
jgi:hypothetical protein